jgi:hypothetical protein
MNIPDLIFENLVSVSVFWGSGILSTLDPGWKKSEPDPGSGIFIPDPAILHQVNEVL